MNENEKIPVGVHRGRVLPNSADYGASSTGTEYVILAVKLLDFGRVVSVYLYLSDKAMPYTIEALRACGWTGDDIFKLDNLDANEVGVSVKYETFDGKERLKTGILGKQRARAENPLGTSDKDALRARVKAALKLQGTPAARPVTGKSDSDDGSGIPF